jgi:hypothetical protein
VAPLESGSGRLAARRDCEPIVYQATPRDPFVFVGVMTTMAVLGFVAIDIPAQRALSVHPAELLRQE